MASGASSEEAEWLRLLLEAGGVGTWRLDPATGRFAWSARAAGLLGLPPQESCGAVGDWLACLHPADRDAAATGLEVALAGPGGAYEAEWRCVAGPEAARGRRLRSLGRIMRDEITGRPLRVLGTLREAPPGRDEPVPATRQEALAEAVPGLLFVTDAAGRNIFTNRRYQDYAGLPAEALLGDGWARVVHPEDVPLIRAAVEAAAAGEPFEVELRMRRGSDGALRRHLVRALPLAGADVGRGPAEAWAGVCIDIEDIARAREATERRSAALEQVVAERTAEIARREAEYRRLYNRAPAPMHSIGPDGALLQVSEEWVRFLGYEREEVVGRSLSELMDEESRRRYLEVKLPRFLRSADGVHEGEYRLRRRSGEWVEVLLRARPERDAEGRFLRSVSVLVDVTGRNRAEAQLRQAQKIEALGQLTSGVAHDFNNMLQAVMSALRLMTRHIPEGPEGARPRRLHAAAMDGAARGARLTQQLLAFARRGRLEPEVVDVNARISAFVEGLLSRALGPNIDLRLELAGDLWPARVDPTQLEVALLNLAVNARDAMAEGGRRGTLAFETANIRLAPGDHLFRGGAGPEEEVGPDGDDGALPAGDYVLVAVTDDGAGMNAATLARATEPFFTTKDLGKGTGLGLSQVYGFARQSGGALRIQSHPGQGTAVHLYLPRPPAAGEGPHASPGPV